MTDQTFLYLIGQYAADGAGPLKVGIAADVYKRRAQLQTANPYHLEIEWYAPFPSRHLAQRVERTIHLALEQHSLSGEWFDCCRSKAGWEVARAIYSFRKELNIRDGRDLDYFCCYVQRQGVN